jgi:hypothetical protein
MLPFQLCQIWLIPHISPLRNGVERERERESSQPFCSFHFPFSLIPFPSRFRSAHTRTAATSEAAVVVQSSRKKRERNEREKLEDRIGVDKWPVVRLEFGFLKRFGVGLCSLSAFCIRSFSECLCKSDSMSSVILSSFSHSAFFPTYASCCCLDPPVCVCAPADPRETGCSTYVVVKRYSFPVR